MTIENLYDYLFWYNHHENLCYAISRDTVLDFFNGNRDKSVYYASKEHGALIDLLTKDNLKHLRHK